jgi:hypothetical protein
VSIRLLSRRALPGRLLRAATSTLACGGVLAAGAQAASAATPPTLSVSPTMYTAATAPASLTATLTFNANSGDSPKDITLKLAPGVLASAAAAGSCVTTANTTVNGPCQVGTDTIDGSIADNAFVVPPPAGVPGAIAGLTTTYLANLGAQPGAVEIRNQAGNWAGTNEPNVGLDVVFSNMPNTGGLLQSLSLTLNPQLNGQQFLRSPSYCGTFAPALLSVDYQGSGGTPAATDVAAPNITVSGCPAHYSPALTATATASPATGGYAVAFSGTITQGSALSSGVTNAVTLTLPSGLSPNLALLSSECSAADVTTCPTATPASVVGSATAHSAALPSSDALSGPIVLTKSSGVLPGLAVIINKIGSSSLPSPIVIAGTTQLASSGALMTTFSGMPDVPLSDLTVSLTNAVLTTTCAATSGTLTGVFTDQSGAQVTDSPTVAFTGCPTGNPGGGGGGGGTPGSPTVTGASVTGLAGGKATFSFTLRAGTNAPKISSFSVSLPKGLSFKKSKSLAKGVTLAGATVKSVSLKGGKLLVTLKSPVTSLKVKISSKVLKVSTGLEKQIKKHKVKSLVATITAGGKAIKLTLTKLK